MHIVNEGNGMYGIERDGRRVVTGESYQVVSNICEQATQGLPSECDEEHGGMSEKQAFQVEHKGFIATGYWGDSADGRVVVTREGKPFKEFAYPAYRIFNIAAHWEDIVEAELEKEANA